MFIKNFEKLATTPQRKIVLQLIEDALSSIQSESVIENSIKLEGNSLTIEDKSFDLANFEKIVLIGFGKGSAKISKLIEEKLGDRLTEGYVIDVSSEALAKEDTNPEEFKKIKFTQGTHPLPSQTNVDFVENLLSQTQSMSEKDLVIVAITGGGSALFEAPNVTLEEITEINGKLLKSGANITEMNTLRKHLSKVKAGNLAKHFFPATIITAICSDVPGNDLSVISSGPTVKDKTNIEDAVNILSKYSIEFDKEKLTETPKDDKYFEKVHNILILSNLTALNAMKKKAEELGYTAEIYSDKFQADAKEAGKELIDNAKAGSILLSGGETTVKVKGHGAGGRNQTVVLSAILSIDEKTVIASVASDGWDNSHFAGAIGDSETIQKAKELGLDPQKFLDDDNSLEFFEKTEEGIDTGRLPSNISDLIIVFKE